MTATEILDAVVSGGAFMHNSLPQHGSPLDLADAQMFGVTAAEEAHSLLSHWPEFEPTPLTALPGLADDIGIGEIYVKDEGHRFGIGSFKALGGAYAVLRLALEKAETATGRVVRPSDLDELDIRAALETMIVTTATDGNHGRSVAWGARQLGVGAVIFVHERVSEARSQAIAAYGAKVIRKGATFDDSVAEAAAAAAANGWTLVADTATPGYERIPGLVMQGYTVLIREALEAMSSPPTHLFVQAGVGGLAAAIAAWLDQRLGSGRPRLIVVEPDEAACLYRSVRAGRSIRVPAGEPTVMAMLECFEPSLVAWRILARVADAFMTVGNAHALDAMNRLARPRHGDPAIVAGESGCASLAGLIHAAQAPDIRAELGLGADSRVLVINTEGATDPGRYAELTGLDPAAVGGTQ